MNIWSLLVPILCAVSAGAAETVWVPGHWTDSSQRHWVSGYYSTAPQPVVCAPPRAVWLEARWVQVPGGWSYEEGHYVQEPAVCAPQTTVVYREPPTVIYREPTVVYREPRVIYREPVYVPAPVYCPPPRSRVSVNVGFYAPLRPAVLPRLPPLPRIHGHIPLPHELVHDLFHSLRH